MMHHNAMQPFMRNPFLDTSKAVLIVLVVFGHFLEKMIGWHDSLIHTLLATIYTVHMPAFVFISGMLFKTQHAFKNIAFFLSLFIPFQLLYYAFQGFWTGNFYFSWNVFKWPYWLLWYLWGMVVWTVLTLILKQIKSPMVSLVIAIILSVIVGLSPWNNYHYSFGRILVFLPFFVIGHFYGKQCLNKIQQQNVPPIFAGLCLMGIAVGMYYSQLSQYWFYGSLSYAQLGVSDLQGAFIRLVCLSISLLGGFAILSLIHCFGASRRTTSVVADMSIGNTILGRWGQYTLPVYLLHGFVVMTVSKLFRPELPLGGLVVVCFVLSLLSCWILARNRFDQLLRSLSLWLMKPTEKLWKK